MWRRRDVNPRCIVAGWFRRCCLANSTAAARLEDAFVCLILCALLGICVQALMPLQCGAIVRRWLKVKPRSHACGASFAYLTGVGGRLACPATACPEAAERCVQELGSGSCAAMPRLQAAAAAALHLDDRGCLVGKCF